MRTSIIKNKERLFSIIFWLLVWSLFSNILKNPILLPRPSEVFLILLQLVKEKYFWSSIFNSVINIGLGFLLGIASGILLGILAYNSSILKNIIEVPMSVIKSIPIASIVVILLIWFSSKELPIIIVLLIVLPNIYYSTLEGLLGVDSKILDMSKVFRVKTRKLIKYVYFEELKVVLLPSIIVSSGLAWKSGVSAEVLGLVKNSIGENIYYSKLYLDTRELFAWTIVIILLSKLFFRIFEYLVRKVND